MMMHHFKEKHKVSEKLTYPYAYDAKKNIVHVSDAIEGNEYFIVHNSKEYKLQNACFDKKEGDIGTGRHWRSWPNSQLSDIERNDKKGLSESVLHLSAKMHLAKTKTFQYKNMVFKGSKVLVEHEAQKAIQKKHPEFNFIPDLLFLDDNNDFLLIAEIKVKNKKSKEIIKEYEKFNLITFELTYEDSYTEPRAILQICKSTEQRQFEFDAAELRSSISRIEIESESIKREIRNAEDELHLQHSIQQESNFNRKNIAIKIRQSIDSAKKVRNNFRRGDFSENEFEIARFKEEIFKEERDRNREIQEFISSIPELEEAISSQQQFGKELERIENEIRLYEKLFSEASQNLPIEWFRPKWMGKSTIEKVKEIKYFCT
jgi:hypothetical protein